MTLIVPGARDALILVDVQNDFLPGGALSVAEGDAVIAPLNRLAERPFGCVVATQDWHPPGHMSFAAQGGPWPDHCVQGTHGADFATALNTAPITHIVRKGSAQDRDSYSGFFDNAGARSTGLDGLLRALGVERVFLGGLALDYCVAATARDSARLGFETYVIEDACRAVDGPGWDARRTFAPGAITVLRADDIVPGHGGFAAPGARST